MSQRGNIPINVKLLISITYFYISTSCLGKRCFCIVFHCDVIVISIIIFFRNRFACVIFDVVVALMCKTVYINNIRVKWREK